MVFRDLIVILVLHVQEKVADCRRVRYEVEEMRRKKKRSKTNDKFVKDDESQQYDQVEKRNDAPKTENI